MLDNLEDLRKFLTVYDQERTKVNDDDTDSTYEDYQNFVLNNLKMPEFYTTKPDRPVFTINHNLGDKIFQAYHPDGKLFKESTDLGDLYQQTREEGQVKFTGDYSDLPYVSTRRPGSNSSLMMDIPGSEMKRMLSSHTDKTSRFLDAENFLRFLYTATKYLENPNDFLNAWEFLDTHPYGWYRLNKDTTDWIMNELVSRMGVAPYLDDKTQTVVFMVESGATYPPERTNRYHDLRLDVYAPSYEQGIIDMAAKVHKFFYLDGSERENVQYEKSKLELLLDERLADLETETQK